MNYVTRAELDKAIDGVVERIDETEQRLREEWTNTVRWEMGRVDDHLGEQDSKINWVLGLIVSLLVAVVATGVGAFIYLAAFH